MVRFVLRHGPFCPETWSVLSGPFCPWSVLSEYPNFVYYSFLRQHFSDLEGYSRPSYDTPNIHV